MPLALEQHLPSRTDGDKALEIVRDHRQFVNDHFRLEVLEREFPRLSYQLGARGLHLAVASDNTAGTFKERGTIVKATELKERGTEAVIAPSAGNHARGAILAAKALDMKVHVVVPTTAPPAKKEGLRDLWPSSKLTIHAVGSSFDESLAWALRNPQHGELLHPYDDPWVIRGQGTLADDILEANEDIQHIVVPVGGGGLAAGVVQRLNELGRGDILVHGIEAEGSDSASRSLDIGAPIDATQPNQRFGGSAVQKIGETGLAIFLQYSNFHLHRVTDEAVDTVTADYEQDRAELDRLSTPNFEPTTLVALAGLQAIVRKYPHEPIAVVGTGYNAPLWTPSPKRRRLSI